MDDRFVDRRTPIATIAASKNSATTNGRSKVRPIGIDLFAGAGGLSLGFEQAGFDIAAAVEIDPIHCATHDYNFPYSSTICASVVDLTGDEIRKRAGIGCRDIDVVFGGAPCQGFSLIGKRALEDPRNHLVFHYVRLVKELEPKYCVFENVKGLTIGEHAKFLSQLIHALAIAGYEVLEPYKVLDAADYGVPQHRHRLFLIGARSDQLLPKYPEPLAEKTTVWQAIGDLPNADDFDELWDSDAVETKWRTRAAYARRLRGLEEDPKDYSYTRIFNSDLLTSSTRTAHTPLSKKRFSKTAFGKVETVSRFHKLDPQGFCNTLRAGTDSARGGFTAARPIHPHFARVITVREAARLHSYPDWFRFHVTKWHGYRQIGNSVPPLLGRAVGAAIMKALGSSPRKPLDVLTMGDQSLLAYDMGDAAKHFEVPRNTIAQRRRKVSSQIELEVYANV
jgi:DNA (cytosine-5)-methyltransferase 1